MLQKFSDLRAFRRDPLAFMLKRGAEAGQIGAPLVPLQLGFRPIYLVADPQLARDVFRANEADIDKGRHIRKLCQVVGLNSITMSGSDQRTRRAVLHKTLTEGLAKDYVPRMGSVVRAWAASLANHHRIVSHEVTAHVTLRLVCTVLFGPDTLSTGDESLLIQAVRLVEDDLAEDMFRVFAPMPWHAAKKRRNIVRAREMMGLVVERACRRATESSLLKALQNLEVSPEALRDEVLILLLAGHHTTGAAAAWMLHAIAADAILAQALAAEAEHLSGVDGELKPVALRSAGNSRALAYEILRLYPSSYWAARDLMRDQTIAGKPLTRGTSLIISQWHLHRDPRYWPDADRLRLDRVWTSNPAYMPFGFGPRTCTGLSIAMLVLQLIALEFAVSFEATLDPATPVGAPRPSVTLKPPPIGMLIVARGGVAAQRDAAA